MSVVAGPYFVISDAGRDGSNLKRPSNNSHDDIVDEITHLVSKTVVVGAVSTAMTVTGKKNEGNYLQRIKERIFPKKNTKSSTDIAALKSSGDEKAGASLSKKKAKSNGDEKAATPPMGKMLSRSKSISSVTSEGSGDADADKPLSRSKSVSSLTAEEGGDANADKPLDKDQPNEPTSIKRTPSVKNAPQSKNKLSTIAEEVENVNEGKLLSRSKSVSSLTAEEGGDANADKPLLKKDVWASADSLLLCSEPNDVWASAESIVYL